MPGQQAQGYFQGNFHCLYSWSNLQVMTKSQSGSKNCMDLISQLNTRKTEIIKQTMQIKPSSIYNQSARAKLIRQDKEIDNFLSQLVQGVNDLENKVKAWYQKKYFDQLKSIRLKLVSKQALLAADQIKFISDWDKKLLDNIIKTIGFNYQRIKLIEGILSSMTLDEMIPLLDTYESLITSQLTWKSE